VSKIDKNFVPLENSNGLSLSADLYLQSKKLDRRPPSMIGKKSNLSRDRYGYLSNRPFYLTLCISASGIFDNFCVTGSRRFSVAVSRHAI
jgi:hypothetical protein